MLSERAFEATAHIEEGWHVEWTGWKLCMSWPMKQGTWWCFSKDEKKTFIQARCFVGDEEKESSVLGHAKDEARLRLRMYIYESSRRNVRW